MIATNCMTVGFARTTSKIGFFKEALNDNLNMAITLYSCFNHTVIVIDDLRSGRIKSDILDIEYSHYINGNSLFCKLYQPFVF